MDMDILPALPGFALEFILIFCYEYRIKLIKTKLKNNVHFYEARDKNKTLWLFLGKPIRDYDCYITKICGSVISNSYNFKHFGLNPDDYKDLKWEDEPVEVFLNLED